MHDIEKKVSNEVDRAEKDFSQCWDILVDLRDRAEPAGLFQFQPTLAKAIYKVGNLHHKLADEEKALIARKVELKPQ